MTGRRDPGGRTGFTLLEVLVGIAVGGVVLLAGFAALGSVHDRTEHGLLASEPALEGAAARALLHDWIASAQQVSQEAGVRFTGLSALEVGTDSDEVIFPTRASTPLGTASTGVRLYVELDPDAPERGLVAELTHPLVEAPLRLELAPGVEGLRIRYLPDAEGAVDWVDTWLGESAPPRAVEITLVPVHPEAIPPLLRLPLRVALPVRN